MIGPKRSLVAQIAEIRREIALRERVYPGLVARGKMRQVEADEHMVLIGNVLETLKRLQGEDSGANTNEQHSAPPG